MGKSKNIKTKNFEMAINKADYDAIIDLAAQHRSKRNSFSFCDELKSLKEDELKKLMKQLLKILMDYMEKNLNQNATVDWTTLNPEQCKMIGQFIQAMTDIGLACVQCDLTTVCRVELVQIAVFLHGIMLPMPDNMDYVKNCIAHYCEKLFSTGLLEKCELFLSNVVLYLVRKTLARRAAKTDVKRMYGIRKILKSVMEQDGPNTAQLWPLFSDCAVSQTYLSILEGQKVVALVMTLNSDKLLEMHEKIKSYVPGVSIKTAIAYGKVYFEAWCYAVKSGNNEMRDIIEITCLQQFITMGIKSQHKHILPIIRKILNQFFIHKKEAEVSKMLYGVYQPLIWRYLKNPNGLYRACAAQLFLDIFPLEDPDMRVVKNEREVNEQLLMIKELLLDDFPIVRITAVLGICVSMSVNWEVFPEEPIQHNYFFCRTSLQNIIVLAKKMLKTFFRIIVDQLSRDSATAEVRIAVVKGLKCLLENPLTVRCLVGVLPKLTGLFHDISENVRIAFCQLLLRVKKISAIKYFHIVPINHLFARMEEDCHAVKKCLANLLHNSYFPKNQGAKVWLGRCLEIIKTERIASRVFFSYVSNFIGVDQSVTFMIQATRAVHFYVKTKSRSSRRDMEISDKENIGDFTNYIATLEQAVGFGNLNIVSTLMEAIAVMWLSLKPESDLKLTKQPGDEKNYMKMLVSRLSSTLQELCLYYKDTEAWEPVFYLSSFLPFSAVASLSSLCFMRIRSLPPDAQESDYMTLLECLANQFQMLELLNILKEWIETGLSSTYVPPPAKKRRGRGKSGEGIHHDQTKPYLANRMLNSVLNHRNLQKRALLERTALQEILYLADNVKRKLERVNARLMIETEADFLNLLIYNIVRISVHLHNHPNYDLSTSVPFLNEFVEWTHETLLQHISTVKDEKNHFTLLIFRICENLCKVLGDVTSLGFFEPSNCLYLDFISALLGTGFGYRFLLIASRFLYKHAASSQFVILLDDNTIMMEYHLRYLSKMFVLMNNEVMLEKISETELGEITFILGNVMQIVHNHVNKLTELSSQVFKTILKNIVDCSAVKFEEIVEEMAEDPFDRLSFPTVGKFFWSIISQKPKLNRTYIKYLIDMFKDSQDIDVSYWIAYWMITWSFLHAKSLSQIVIKEIHSLVLHLETFIHNLYPRVKDSEENNSQDNSSPVPLQLFQHHCHAELIKLKNRVKSKLRVS